MPSVPGWRSHEEIIAWQFSSELKNHVYRYSDCANGPQRPRLG